MRAFVVAFLLLQFGATQASGPVASPEHLRWQRSVQLPAGASGRACAVLDATSFAHAAGRSQDDLRLYVGGIETPFALSESEPVAADVQTATVQNPGMRNGDVVVDLAMPARAYTDVTLKLGGKNFVATAKVSAPDGTQLGTFALFDLSQQGLSRSTTLTLQESTFPMLHVALHVTSIDGKPYPGLTPQIVEGADIPPSREAQTLYTPVAATSTVVQKGKQSVITFQIPAHVPVERVVVGFAPGFTKEFSRRVNITAMAMKKNANDAADAGEHIVGVIWRITRNSEGGGPAIHQEKLSVDAEIASNLRDPATVTIAVENGDDVPLAIQSVQLQMRQRVLCFDAASGASYIMRYGDAALRAPVYDYARLFQQVQVYSTIAATLGPELPNADYHPRPDERPFTERHPELMWVALILVVAVLGGTALHSVKTKKHSAASGE